ncbi:MAG TPA: hypothetical protein VGG45_19135 [Terracidiphilus sp.]
MKKKMRFMRMCLRRLPPVSRRKYVRHSLRGGPSRRAVVAMLRLEGFLSFDDILRLLSPFI